MKKIALLFVSLLIISNCIAQDQIKAFFEPKAKPQVQNLGNLATITFIDTPKVKPSKTGMVYTLNNDGNLYLAQIGEAKKNLADQFTAGINDTVYNSYINGFLKDLEGTLFYRKDTVIANLPGVAFAYKGHVDSTTCYNYHYVSYLNEHIIGITVWSADSLSWHDPKIKTFFNTFKLTANGKEIREREMADTNINVGHVVAVSGAIIGGILVIFAVIFFIRKKAQG